MIFTKTNIGGHLIGLNLEFSKTLPQAAPSCREIVSRGLGIPHEKLK